MTEVPSATTSYREIRKVSVELHRKYSEASRALRFNPLHGAKRLTLKCSGRTLILEDEADIAAFSDDLMYLP